MTRVPRKPPMRRSSFAESLIGSIGPIYQNFLGTTLPPQPKPPAPSQEKRSRWRSERSIDLAQARDNMIESWWSPKSVAIRKLSNWQLNQWIRAGRKVKRLAEFRELVHP